MLSTASTPSMTEWSWLPTSYWVRSVGGGWGLLIRLFVCLFVCLFACLLVGFKMFVCVFEGGESGWLGPLESGPGCRPRTGWGSVGGLLVGVLAFFVGCLFCLFVFGLFVCFEMFVCLLVGFKGWVGAVKCGGGRGREVGMVVGRWEGGWKRGCAPGPQATAAPSRQGDRLRGRAHLVGWDCGWERLKTQKRLGPQAAQTPARLDRLLRGRAHLVGPEAPAAPYASRLEPRQRLAQHRVAPQRGRRVAWGWARGGAGRG
jgi:hypothetical protein